jgi:proteasome accessory factor C
VAERLEVEFDYFSHGRGSTERRSVRPLELFSHRGQWYLSGFCNARGEERLFRVDRIAGLELTHRVFEPSQSRHAVIPNPVQGGDVRVRFSKVVAPYVMERFGDDARPAPEGAVDVRVSGESERWLAQWVLSFGGEAEVIEPQWAREVVARAARACLA